MEEGEGSTLKDAAATTVQSTSTTGNRCTCCWNDSERLLWIMLSVNSVLTVVQLTFGVVANSLSLLGDGALMGMDSVCYAVAIYAERHKVDAAQSKRVDRLGALFSTVMLACTTAWVLFDAVDRLVGDSSSEDPGVPQLSVEVNGSLMIAFTVFNLAVDFMVVLVAWHLGAAMFLEGPGDSTGANKDRETNTDANPEDASSANLNIFGALAHLAADGVRGVAVLITGIIAVTGLVDAAKADAYCSLFVCLFVLAAAFSLLRVLLRHGTPVAYQDLQAEEQKGQATQAAGGQIHPTTFGAGAHESVSPKGWASVAAAGDAYMDGTQPETRDRKSVV